MRPAVVFEKAPRWWPRVVIPLCSGLVVVLGVMGLRHCGSGPEVSMADADAGVPVSSETPMVCDDCDVIAASARAEVEARSEETVQRLKDALSICVARKPAQGATKALADKLRATEKKLAAAEAKLARGKTRPVRVAAKEAPAPEPPVARPEPADLPKDGPDVVAERIEVPARVTPTRDKPRSLLEVIEAYEKSGP